MAEFPQTLVSPDGREAVVTSAGEYNDLIHGLGYRPKPQEADEPAPDPDPEPEPTPSYDTGGLFPSPE
jgi:hypothetical protein